MPSAPSPTFAARFLHLLGDAGWRIVLHVLPYALAAGAITEAALRLRLPLVWRLPLVALAFASLHLAVLLGAHVTTLRPAVRQEREPAPIRHLFVVAGRLFGETATAALVCLIATLALVGALDLFLQGLPPAPEARWPTMVLRMIATLGALSAMVIAMAGATALSASTFGRRVDLAAAASVLFRRSERTTAVVCIAIAAGTATAIMASRLLGTAELGPVIVASALAKAAGYLAMTVSLSIGAALMAADP